MRICRTVSHDAVLAKKNELEAQFETFAELSAAVVHARAPHSRKSRREDPNEIQPYWLAARLMAFVGEGGLDEARERFILIHLPLPRAEQYYHALLKYAGFRTYPLPENAGIRVEAPENAPDLSPLEDDPELAEALRRFGLEDA